jgi:hypothetical protein
MIKLGSGFKKRETPELLKKSHDKHGKCGDDFGVCINNNTGKYLRHFMCRCGEFVTAEEATKEDAENKAEELFNKHLENMALPRDIRSVGLGDNIDYLNYELY